MPPAPARRTHARPAKEGPLLRLLNFLPLPLGRFSPTGALIYANEALADLFVSAENDAGRIRQESAQLARRAAAPRRWGEEQARGEVLLTGIPERTISSSGGRYRLTATVIDDVEGRDSVVVLVEVCGPEMVTDPELRRRWRLSPQEVRVARLLAERRTDREVAAALGVSIHTAHHHVARVRQKLGVQSRAQVASRLLERPTTTT